jgi:hypothetical protein
LVETCAGAEFVAALADEIKATNNNMSRVIRTVGETSQLRRLFKQLLVFHSPE